MSQEATNQNSTITNNSDKNIATPEATVIPTVLTPSTPTESSSVTAPRRLQSILDDKNKKTQRGKLHGSALRHLHIFFRDHWAGTADLPATGNIKHFKTFEDIDYEDLKNPANDFFEELATYFAERAHDQRKGKKNTDLLSFNAAINYFSAIKNHLIDRFRKEGARKLPIFDERTHAKYHDNIRKLKTQQAREAGKKVVNSKDMATDEEISGLGAVCLWNGTLDGLNFFLLNKLILQLGARTCEAASQRIKDLTYHVVQEGTEEFDVLEFYLDRNKTSTSQNPVVFNHRKGILFDLYFALGTYFLLADDGDEMLFPEFYESIKGKNKGDALDSKASNMWTKLYTRMMKIVNDFEGKYIFI